MAKLAFIGLGVMGYPMAGHLRQAGHDLTVFNRASSKAQAWVDHYGGRAAPSPAQAARGAEIVFSCVGRDDDLWQVTMGEGGAFETMTSGIFVDHTTVSAAITQRLASEASARGVSFIDAPVSGGQAGAENGQLSIMCGGDAQAYECAEAIMQAYAKICKRMGDSGAGQMTKMCNQIAIAGLVQSLSESLNFAQLAGLDGRAVLDVISAGAAGSWQMSNRGETMLDGAYDFGFAVDWMRKDLGICLQAAEDIGASLPVTAVVDQFYKDVQNAGGGRLDTSSLMQRLVAQRSK